MDDAVFLKLHYEGQVMEIPYVETDTYSYVVLLSDMTEKFYNDPVLWQRLKFKVTSSVPGGKETMVVNNDSTLMEVFKLHGGKDYIDFHFTVIEDSKLKKPNLFTATGVQGKSDVFGLGNLGSYDDSVWIDDTGLIRPGGSSLDKSSGSGLGKSGSSGLRKSGGKSDGYGYSGLGKSGGSGEGRFGGSENSSLGKSILAGMGNFGLGNYNLSKRIGASLGISGLGVSGLAQTVGPGLGLSGLIVSEVGNSFISASAKPSGVGSSSLEASDLTGDEVHAKWGSGLTIDELALATNPFLLNAPISQKPRRKRLNEVCKSSIVRKSVRTSLNGECNGDGQSCRFGEDDVQDSDSSEDELYVISDDDDENLTEDHTLFLLTDTVDEGANDSDSGLSGSTDSYHIDDHHLDDSDSDMDDDPMKGWLNKYDFIIPEGQKFKLERGMMFENIDAYRKVLYEYSIQWGFTLKKTKNERNRVTAECNDEGCKWRAHASLMPDNITFCIKTCNPDHSCMADPNLQASAKWMSSRVEGLVRGDRNVSIHVMREALQQYGINPADLQLFRARKLAIERIDGSHSVSYSLMPKYCRMVMLNDRQNVAKIQYYTPLGETVPYVKRVFVGYAALKNGFMAGCPPFIGFDGCHLKGPYGGVLLSAVGLDGNNGLVPIANAVVEAENRDSWAFFLTLLSDLMDDFHGGCGWTFMSDRQKGLTEALLEKVPHARHRKCCHHIESNFKAIFPAIILRKLFWAAAKAYTKEEYSNIMQKINKIKPDAYKWLEKAGPDSWARHAFSESLKCDQVTNNLSESFNSWIGKFRNKPILNIFESIRRKLMAKIQKRYAKACGWTNDFTPRVEKALRKAAQDCRPLTYWKSKDETYEVKDGERSYVVKLNDRHCDCRVWNHTGIPCKHATVVVLGNRRKLSEYCDPMLSKKNYLSVYSHVMDPIPDQMFWPQMQETICKPPLLRRRVGRPTSTRRRAAGEGPSSMKRSFIIRCGKCGASGHNQRSCAGGPVRTRNKRKRTRTNENQDETTVTAGAPTQSSQNMNNPTGVDDFVNVSGSNQPSQTRKRKKTVVTVTNEEMRYHTQPPQPRSPRIPLLRDDVAVFDAIDVESLQ